MPSNVNYSIIRHDATFNRTTLLGCYALNISPSILSIEFPG